MTRIFIQTAAAEGVEKIVWGVPRGPNVLRTTDLQTSGASADELDVIRWSGEGGADPDARSAWAGSGPRRCAPARRRRPDRR